MNERTERLLFACGLMLCGSSAFAQGQSPVDSSQTNTVRPTLEEVVVTAEKEVSTVQRTPGAVIAQSAEALIRQNITDVSNLAKGVPGLQSTATPIGGSSIVLLRGVGQSVGADNTQPGVAFNFDGIYQPRQLSHASFYDVASVEVLPGPQGTLYGRNAAGGVINVTINRPSDELEGSLLVEGGNYGHFRSTGVLNVPLSESLAIRVAADHQKNDGYLSNGLNDADTTSARLSVLFEPNDQFSLNVSASGFEAKGKGSPVIIRTAVPGLSAYVPDNEDPWSIPDYPTNGLAPYPSEGPFRDFRGGTASATAAYQFDSVTLSYLAGYAEFDHDTLYPNGSLRLRLPTEGSFVSHELRLASNGESRSKWLVGLYLYTGDSRQSGTISPVPAPVIGPLRSSVTYDIDDLEASAAFAQYTYAVTDRVRLTLGGRYSQDEMDGGGQQVTRTLAGNVISTISYGTPIDDERLDWKAGFEVDVGADSMLYANVQTGYLQGGFTPVVPGSGSPTTFEPATLLAYNLGIKNRILDDRLQINDEFFYYDYDDYQVSYVQAPLTVTTNAPKAEIFGNQLDIRYLLAERTELFLTGTWQHAEFREFANPIAPFQNLKGSQLQFSPELSGTAGVRQEWVLGSLGTFAGSVQVYYNSGFWGTYAHAADTRQGSYTNTDLTLTYTTPNERWSISAYANNLEDEVVYANPTQGAVGIGPTREVVSTINPPLTYGLRLIARFP